MPGQSNTTISETPVLEERDKILFEWKLEVIRLSTEKIHSSKILQISAPEQAKKNILHNHTDGNGDKKMSLPRQPGLSFSQLLVRSQKHIQKLAGR